MSVALCRQGTRQIAEVIIYKGHETHPLLGPYHENIDKCREMFEGLNPYRKARHLREWNVICVRGEDLTDKLSAVNPLETLLVIPAGQSSRLDAVFTPAQNQKIIDFFKSGGKGYKTCGAAYRACETREYSEVCEVQPDSRKLIIKKSDISVGKVKALGPLCPFPGARYKVGFYSDAVEVVAATTDKVFSDTAKKCTIFLSGGGSFIPEPQQPFQTLVHYPTYELQRLGKQPSEQVKLENAAILVPVGLGAVLLSMFHPYYGSQDIDVERYQKALPDAGTDWNVIHQKLSSHDHRMNFVLDYMLFPLENYNPSPRSSL